MSALSTEDILGLFLPEARDTTPIRPLWLTLAAEQKLDLTGRELFTEP